MIKMLKKYERTIAILLIAFLALPVNLFTSIATVLAEDGNEESIENVVIHHDFEEDDTHGWAPLGWIAATSEVEVTSDVASNGDK